MVQKYIIDKADIHDLLTGKDIPLEQGSKARAFCVEIAGGMTNGDAIISLYPDLKYTIQNGRVITTIGVASSFDLEWWNTPYKAESEGTNDKNHS